MTVFTPDEVVNLDKYQREGRFHGFTCGNRGDSNHRVVGGDKGLLIPTVQGWVCQFCDYTQDWAHEFMKKGEPVSKMEFMTTGRQQEPSPVMVAKPRGE